MFLKSLEISSGSKVIREIIFNQRGISLIVDDSDSDVTGNNVGKTTVLKLIDFCLGSNPNSIWADPENKKEEYSLVKKFLKDEKVLIALTLVESLSGEDVKEVIIERNFLSRKGLIRRINGNELTEDEFDERLSKILFPNLIVTKPTFRQLISHNIRYKDESVINTLRTLDKYSSDVEYETLHLFMLGIEFDKGSSKQDIILKLKQEETFKLRLEKTQTKSAYENALALIENDIEKLNNKKRNFNLNEEYELDFDRLTNVKYRINSISTEITNLNIRRELILEAEAELSHSRADIDMQQLQIIYQQASLNIEGIQKRFSDLVDFHNQMIEEKSKFLLKELPKIQDQLNIKQTHISNLRSEEKNLAERISKSDSFEELEKVIVQLNEKYRKKGEYENIVLQLTEADEVINELNEQLKSIESGLFSNSFENKVKEQVQKFNKFFAYVSDYLYGEQYALKYDIISNKKGQKVYKFSAFNTNFSSGKKQGEISCFDIAYTLFAEQENIPCLHFILNDKKELMHDNQLVRINDLVSKCDIQFVASILKDKLPPELNREEYFVVELSQSDKLFRIENS